MRENNREKEWLVKVEECESNTERVVWTGCSHSWIYATQSLRLLDD